MTSISFIRTFFISNYILVSTLNLLGKNLTNGWGFCKVIFFSVFIRKKTCTLIQRLYPPTESNRVIAQSFHRVSYHQTIWVHGVVLLKNQDFSTKLDQQFFFTGIFLFFRKHIFEICCSNLRLFSKKIMLNALWTQKPNTKTLWKLRAKTLFYSVGKLARYIFSHE